MLQAALNGPFTKAEHAALPMSPAELAADASECAEAGARSFHVHPRDGNGSERLEASIVDPVVAAVRGTHGFPVGVSTGAWIEPDVERRIWLVSAWREPDYASVNVSEDGSFDVMRALIQGGTGIEVGVWSVADAEALVDSGLADKTTRVLVEPVDVGREDAVPTVDAIHRVLDEHDVSVPRLQHGDGDATWILVEDAAARGIDTRIGFEDTLVLPDGTRAPSNAALVSAARSLGAGASGA